jgi:hypothetical protein
MVAREGQLHHFRGRDCAVTRDRRRSNGSYPQDRGLRRLDDADELVDAEHSQVAYCERPA